MRLSREASLRKDYLGSETVSTIYLGGGTPSVLSLKELGTILDQSEEIVTMWSRIVK